MVLILAAFFLFLPRGDPGTYKAFGAPLGFFYFSLSGASILRSYVASYPDVSSSGIPFATFTFNLQVQAIDALTRLFDGLTGLSLVFATNSIVPKSHSSCWSMQGIWVRERRAFVELRPYA